VKPYNLNEPQFTDDEGDPDGYRTAYERIAPKVGGDKLGATHYLIRPGQHLCPYHYEYAEEEWLLVLIGHPTVREMDVPSPRDYEEGRRPETIGLRADRKSPTFRVAR